MRAVQAKMRCGTFTHQQTNKRHATTFSIWHKFVRVVKMPATWQASSISPSVFSFEFYLLRIAYSQFVNLNGTCEK